MPKKDHEFQLTRYDTIEERNVHYQSWVKKNGFPKLDQGCICCAELTCLKDCIGITDERIKKMD